MKASLLKAAFVAVFAWLPLSGYAWNEHTHRAIAIYATENLKPKVKRQVEAILGGTMAEHSAWLNTQKRVVRGSARWHNIVLDEQNNPVGDERDGLTKIAEYERVLRNRRDHSTEEVATALKSLIHVVSDIHNPSHVVFTDIPRSRGFKFKTTNNRTGAFAHRGMKSWRHLWNITYPRRHRGFSVEWSAYDLSVYAEHDKAEWSKGTPHDWAIGQGAECRPLYDIITGEQVVTPDIINRLENIHDRCAARAALRLAALLNNIFS